MEKSGGQGKLSESMEAEAAIVDTTSDDALIAALKIPNPEQQRHNSLKRRPNSKSWECRNFILLSGYSV